MMTVSTMDKMIGLSVALLGQAPGTDLLNQWIRLYTQSREDGMDAMATLQRVAQHILDSDAFAEVHPAYLIIEDSDFAQRFLNSLLGETASAEVVTLVVGLLDSGTSRAEVAVRAVEYLLEVNQQGSDHADHQAFGAYAMRFGNQVEVARYYTIEKEWMTPSESVLAGVDGTAASVTAAKGSIDGMQQPGKNFALTTGVDQFTGTLGNDTFVATESTLNVADRLNGKAGKDTLELSTGSGNADISIPRGATVEHIETLSVSSDGDFSGDVSQWTGLETVKLEVVKNVDLELKAGGGTEVTSTSLGDDDKASTVTIENAGMVELAGVNHNATVKISGEGTESVMVEGGKGVDVNSAASPSLTLKSVTLDGVHNGMGKDGKRYGTGENKDSVPVHIYSKAIEDITVRNTNTTLLVQNDDKDMTELTAMVDQFGMYATAAEHGKLCLKGIEDLMLKVEGKSNIRLASDQIKQVEVSGAGDLRLNVTRFAPAVAEKATDLKASTTLETLMLSGSGKFMLDAKGLSKLITVDASDASGDVDIKNLGNSVVEYTGSAGKDMISVTAFNSKGLMANLGDGDDTFTVKNISAGKSRVDGGAGMDTLVLTEQVGANLKGAGDAYSNFETITLEAGQGEGIYDLQGLDIDKLMVSGGAKSGGITFKNVMSGTDLTVSSKLPDSATGKSVRTTPSVNYMLADGEAELSFEGGDSSGVFKLHLHTTGGEKDTMADLIKTERGSTRYHNPTNRINFTVDKDVGAMIVHSTATVNASGLKAENYTNVLNILAGDGIQKLKVTGDARTVITAQTALKSMSHLDARESSGGLTFLGPDNSPSVVEIHGTNANDHIVTGNGKDKLMGYGGNDLLLGGAGADTFTGGAGGDLLIGNNTVPTLAILSTTSVYLGILYPAGGRHTTADRASDTYVYTAVSDSQVNLDTMTGFDMIHSFSTGDGDKIQLGSVPGLKWSGTVIRDLSGDTEKAKSLKTRLIDENKAKDFFLNDSTPNNGSLDTSEFKTKHSVAHLVTTEKKSVFFGDNLEGIGVDTNADVFRISGNNIKITWLLVDVNGSGSFEADADMAIALLGNDNWLGPDNFS